MGLRPLFAYTLMTIGTPLSLMLNPVFWSLTIGYIVTRSQFIHDLFPTPVFYMGFVTAIIGNYILFYLQVIACLSEPSLAWERCASCMGVRFFGSAFPPTAESWPQEMCPRRQCGMRQQGKNFAASRVTGVPFLQTGRRW